ncbi:unnamed protein product [Toxocara canis]|uniref:BRCT domain-containing protein n=1 Tax=Toxocara canis TaxID=6265 RepID=A0A183UHA7_TOXCA|nr:unnamed protein product [Toxocara canis]
MSDVEVLSPTSPRRLSDAGAEQREQELEADENDTNQVEAQGEDEQQKAEQEEGEGEKRPAEEDRTEDQVPDITGTENVDLMTTSMDGIEELPASEETQAAESTEVLDASPQMVEATPEGVTEEEAENAATDEQSLQEAEIQSEHEPHEEGVEEEEQVVETEPETEIEVQAIDEAAAETEAKHEEDEEHVEHETLVEDNAEEQKADEGAFELQAPPTPKRPRTPNELDNVVLSEENNATEEVTEEQVPVEEGSIETQQSPLVEVAAENKMEEETQETTIQNAEEPVAATPNVPVGSIPSTPKSATLRATEDTPSTPRNAAASPRSPLIKNGESKTPATGTPHSKKAFDFEHTPVGTPRAPKSATFDDSVTSPKTPKSARTPKTPRTPKSPKASKTEVEAPSEAVLEEEPAEEKEPEHEPLPEPAEPFEAVEEKVEEDIERKDVEEEHHEEVTEVAEEIKEPTPPAAEEAHEAVEAPIVEAEGDEGRHEMTEAEEETPMKESRQEIPERVSPPPRARRERSPSPVRQKQAIPHEVSFNHYDQDSFRTKGAPTRLPTNESFSSYTPVEKAAYSAISPWVQSSPRKYHTDYSRLSTYRSPSLYLSQFDEMVSTGLNLQELPKLAIVKLPLTGAFSASLYSTNRLLERSRSRARERKHAMRSARSASNYYRYTSTYATTPIRTREYSTPPSSILTRQPSRSTSFISFMEYSDAKQHEMMRSRSRSHGLESLYSRSGSRINIEPFYETGRLSRVDSYVRDMNRQYESRVPSAYAKYRSSSRSSIYAPLDGCTVRSKQRCL